MRDELELPGKFFWCRKAIYQVQIELGCYLVTPNTPLLAGFEEMVVVGDDHVERKIAVKSGINKLERNSWTTSLRKPFIITGTVGERWIVGLSNLKAYNVDPAIIGVDPLYVSTVDPSEQEFLVAYHIPMGESIRVIPDWAFLEDGTVNESQIMVANSPDSEVSHDGGDFVVAKFIPGRPQYMELSEEERNTPEAAKLYQPRIVNGSIMKRTYDTAKTQDEIWKKYSNGNGMKRG